MAAERERRPDSKPRRISWRQLRGVMLILLLAGALGYGVNWLRDPLHLPLKRVGIDGQFQHLQRAQLERVVAAAVEGNFFTLDVQRVQQAAEQLAWVERVSVRRIWPDTLRMLVIEQQPVARWGSRQLVNARGELFTPGPAEIPPGLPELKGPDDYAPRVVQEFAAIRQQVAQLGIQPLELRWEARGARRVVFDNGLQLYMGSRDNPIGLETFIRVYPELLVQPGRAPARVDLRYTNGLAVGWKVQGKETVGKPVANDSKGTGAKRAGGQV